MGRAVRVDEARSPAGRPEVGRAVAEGAVRCELASPGDDAALRALLREAPMDGWVRLAFPSEPSYFAAAALEGERHATVVVRRERDGAIVAFGSRSVKPVHLAGRPALLGYLGRLRFAPGWRAGRRTLARGYALARSLRSGDELPFDLTAVVADNVPARRLLERGLPGLPRYTPLAELVTRVLPTGSAGPAWARTAPTRRLRGRRGSRRSRGGIRVVEASDGSLLDAMAGRLAGEAERFRLAPRWSRARLGELAAGGLGPWHPLLAFDGGDLVGCGAVWDQRPLRQCVVTGYAPWVGRLRPLLGLGLRAVGRPALPPPGTVLRMGYLSHLAADGPDAMAALVAAARTRAAALGLRRLAVGLPPDHEATGGPRVPGGHAYRSVLYAVHDPGFGGPSPELDEGEVRVEVATL